jgi:hypothetical protein
MLSLLPAQALLDHNFGAKVLPADGTSGAAAPLLGPRMNGLGFHDAQVWKSCFLSGVAACMHERFCCSSWPVT